MFDKSKYTLQFLIGQSECGTFVAVTKAEPFFCIERRSKQEAIDGALKAWEFFLESTGEKAKPHLSTQEIFQSFKRCFVPQEILTAHAC